MNKYLTSPVTLYRGAGHHKSGYRRYRRYPAKAVPSRQKLWRQNKLCLYLHHCINITLYLAKTVLAGKMFHQSKGLCLYIYFHSTLYMAKTAPSWQKAPPAHNVLCIFVFSLLYFCAFCILYFVFLYVSMLCIIVVFLYILVCCIFVLFFVFSVFCIFVLYLFSMFVFL